MGRYDICIRTIDYHEYVRTSDNNPSLPIDHPIKGRIEADEEVPTEKYYKPHFLQSPPQEISVLDGKFVRLDIKVSMSNLLLRVFSDHLINLILPCK